MPPVRRSAGASSFSQRGSQLRGSLRSETTISAWAQALVIVVQSMLVLDRVANTRHSVAPFRTNATHESLEQSL